MSLATVNYTKRTMFYGTTPEFDSLVHNLIADHALSVRSTTGDILRILSLPEPKVLNDWHDEVLDGIKENNIDKIYLAVFVIASIGWQAIVDAEKRIKAKKLTQPLWVMADRMSPHFQELGMWPAYMAMSRGWSPFVK